MMREMKVFELRRSNVGSTFEEISVTLEKGRDLLRFGEMRRLGIDLNFLGSPAYVANPET